MTQEMFDATFDAYTGGVLVGTFLFAPALRWILPRLRDALIEVRNERKAGKA